MCAWGGPTSPRKTPFLSQRGPRLALPCPLVVLVQVIAKSTDRGVDSGGVTLEGFLFLHRLFVERGRLETT